MKYYEIEAHSSRVKNVKFDLSGHSIFSLGFNGEIREWDAYSLDFLAEYLGHSKTVNDLLIDETNQELVSISSDGSIKTWDRTSKKEKYSSLLDKKGLTSLVDVSDRGLWLSASSQKLLFYDLKNSKITLRIICKFKDQRILDFNCKNKILAIGGLGGFVQLVSSENGELIKEIREYGSAVSGLKFLNNSNYISVGSGGEISIFDFENEKEIDGKILKGENFYAIALNTLNGKLAISSKNKVSLLDSSSLEVVNEFETTSKGNYGLSFSPSGKMLALASADKKVRVWKFCAG